MRGEVRGDVRPIVGGPVRDHAVPGRDVGRETLGRRGVRRRARTSIALVALAAAAASAGLLVGFQSSAAPAGSPPGTHTVATVSARPAKSAKSAKSFKFARTAQSSKSGRSAKSAKSARPAKSVPPTSSGSPAGRHTHAAHAHAAHAHAPRTLPSCGATRDPFDPGLAPPPVGSPARC